MKALVLTQYNQLEIQDLPRPQIKADEVLVQVKACGICGSDVHGMDGSTGRRQPPVVMGHEAAGVIVEVGSNVDGFAVNDRVTFDSTIYCGQCRYCIQGSVNLCVDRRVIGVSCDEYRQQGAFAEFIALPARILYPFGSNLDFEKACLVEPLSVALHAVNITQKKLGDIAVVIGAGTIGHLTVQAARLAGLGRLIVVDLVDSRLQACLRKGADVGLNPKTDDVVARLKELTKGHMADIVFEAVGTNETVNLGIDCLKKGGQLTLIGNVAPSIDLPLQKVVTRELTLNGSCASSGEYPACLEFLERGDIQVDEIVSSIEPMDEGQQWFERLYQQEPGLNKVVLRPST